MCIYTHILIYFSNKKKSLPSTDILQIEYSQHNLLQTVPHILRKTKNLQTLKPKMSSTRIHKAILKNKAISLKKTKAKYDARLKALELKIQSIDQFNEQACMRLFKNTRQIDLIKKFINVFEENFDNFTNEYDMLVSVNSKKIDAIEPRILKKVANVLHKFGLQEAISPSLTTYPTPEYIPQLVATAPLFHDFTAPAPAPESVPSSLNAQKKLFLQNGATHRDSVMSPPIIDIE